MGRHSGASDTYSDAYADASTDAYAPPHAGAYADAYAGVGAGQEAYGYPDHSSGEYAVPAPGAYYAVVDTSGGYAQVGHGYAGENAYAAPSHPDVRYQAYQEPAYQDPAVYQDAVYGDTGYQEPAYQEPAYHSPDVAGQGGYAAFAPQTPQASQVAQAPQQPYWDDPAAWETAPGDPVFDTDSHGHMFHQAGVAYVPDTYAEAYPEAYAHTGVLSEAHTGTYAQPVPQRVLEPEFDPEPAARQEIARVEPVDEQPMPRRLAGGAFAVLTEEIEEADATAPPDAGAPRRARDDDGPSGGYAPRTAAADSGSGRGRAAARRASSRPPARKPRRMAAAGGAVVTGAVLAGVVVVQMPDNASQGQASGDTARADTQARDTEDAASRDSERGQVGAVPTAPTPGPSTIPLPTPSAPQTTTDRMKLRFDLDPLLSLSGKFDALPGQADTTAKAGTKTKTYRIEVEQGLALDGNLFAEAVQQTLNDPRSWAHDGRTFVRVGGDADFVIRLASPGTTHRLCGVVGLDTSEDNVSCDASGTPYVVINAWRWAQGSPTFGDEMVGYRQMLINHEVGHRLGRNHETEACLANDLAPVMMQQTKSLEADNGLVCKPNAWPYPTA